MSSDDFGQLIKCRYISSKKYGHVTNINARHPLKIIAIADALSESPFGEPKKA